MIVRFDSRWKKLSYAIICALIYLIDGVLVKPLSTSLDIVGITHGILVICMVVFGARTFRAPNEDRGPRPWWKFCANERLGWSLGSLFAATGMFLSIGWGTDVRSGAPVRAYSYLIVDCLVFCLLALFSLNSGVRLRSQRRYACEEGTRT